MTGAASDPESDERPRHRIETTYGGNRLHLAWIPSVGGVFSQGRTLQAARIGARHALALVLDAYERSGAEPVPEPVPPFTSRGWRDTRPGVDRDHLEAHLERCRCILVASTDDHALWGAAQDGHRVTLPLGSAKLDRALVHAVCTRLGVPQLR